MYFIPQEHHARIMRSERALVFPFHLVSQTQTTCKLHLLALNLGREIFFPLKETKINSRPGGKMLHTDACIQKNGATRPEKIQAKLGKFFLTEEPDCCSLRLSQECIILCPLLYHVCKNKQRSQGNLPPPFFHVELISKPHYL